MDRYGVLHHWVAPSEDDDSTITGIFSLHFCKLMYFLILVKLGMLCLWQTNRRYCEAAGGVLPFKILVAIAHSIRCTRIAHSIRCTRINNIHYLVYLLHLIRRNIENIFFYQFWLFKTNKTLALASVLFSLLLFNFV